MRPYYLIFFLTYFCPFLLRAGTIVVTTNAESGPGSLRWAIETANSNGVAVQDVIQFNIPSSSFNDHIIQLTAELPALTSNIIIDGTTQPGEYFGPTNAKVALKQDQYAPSFSIFKINNAKNVGIYGLYLFIGYWEGIFWSPVPIPSRSQYLYGINISNSSDIEVGAPGKGNVINGANYAIYSMSDSCRNIRVRSNFIGIGPYYNTGNNPAIGTDIDEAVLIPEYGILFKNVRDVTVGGDDPLDGNVISCSKAVYIKSDDETKNGYLKIRYNLFNKWYDKVRDIEYSYVPGYKISIGGDIGADKIDFNVSLVDNYINGAVSLYGLTTYFNIQRNHFNLPADYRYSHTKLTVRKCEAGGMIGSMNTSDGNRFTNKYEFGEFSMRMFNNGPVTVLKNVFHCNYSYGSGTWIEHETSDWIPVVQIDNTTATSVSGRATPNTRVDLYYDDECNACEGEVYLASVNADASGKWQYNGTIARSIVAMATSSTGYSGQFNQPRFNQSKRVIVQPTCGKANGKITGITGEGAETYFWMNLQTGDTVSRSLDLLNAGAGEYLLYGRHGTSCISSIGQSIMLENFSPQISTANAYASQPSCGKFNGSINNVVFTTANFEAKWINENNTVVGRNADVGNLGPGKYSFIVADTTAAGGCADTATFELINQSGPSLQMSQMQVQAATCFNADGSIRNISSQNSIGFEFIRWIDSAGNIVGNTLDLLNVPGGKYRMKYKDQSACDTIVTPEIVVPSPQLNFIKPVKINAGDGYCGIDNGYIIIEQFDKDPAGYSFSWIEKNTGNEIGIGASVSGLSSGNYIMLAKDQNGCSKEIFSKQVTVHPIPVPDYSRLQITDENCSLQNGSVTGIQIIGAQGAPQYQWLSASGNQAGVDADLHDAAAGKYKLVIKDEKACVAESKIIEIRNTDVMLSSPVYDNLIIPKNTSTTLMPKTASVGSYILYADANGRNMITENTTGIFETSILSSDAVYYVMFVSGTCSSPLVQVKITVVDKSFFVIPNAFTPNRDGRNEYVEVKVMGHVQLNYFRIFNRYGQEVFSSRKLNDKWDGRVNGKEASVGTYIWMAQGLDLLGKTITGSGTITLLR